MFEGLDVSMPVRVLGAIIILVALLGAFFWVVRWFGGERLGTTTARGRQPRLAVIDAATVDGRRRLVLIRRDNVEHLLMIGGPSDLVVEPNIVRAAGAAREAPAARPPTAPDTLPRAVPLGEGTMWPLQPEPAPVAREPLTREPPPPREPVMREPPTPREPMIREPMIREPVMREPPQRPQRVAVPPPPPPEESMEWSEEPEPAPPPPPQRDRRPRAPDPLAGLAEELSRAPAPQPEPGEPREARQPRREQRPAPRPQPAPAPAPAPTAEQFNSAADQNLAEMAQRLEAALRRPGKTEEPRFAEAARAAPEPAGAETDDYPPPPPPSRAPAAAEARPARGEPRPGRADGKAPAGKSLYDSLEQEMASLLGRPEKKP
jgi:flagellar protein FliO/FliZ